MVAHRFWNHHLPQILAATAATFGIFAFGTTIGWASPAVPSLAKQRPFIMSPSTSAWISSITVLGAAFSCPFAGFFAEKIGRKRTIFLMSFPFVVGWLLSAFATNASMFQLGRFITGFCGGTYSVTVPMYISEISESHVRGRLGGMFQVMFVLGILCSYVIGSFMDWFFLTMFCSVLPFMLAIFTAFMPESPHYLLGRGRISEASRRLCWLRSAGLSVNVDAELRQIQKGVQDAKELRTGSSGCCTSNTLKPSFICLALMTFQQFSGIHAVLFYAHSIFGIAKSSIDDRVESIVLALFQVIATILSLFLVDRGGRKILLLVSQIVVTISLILVGLYFYLKSFGDEYIVDLGFFPLVGLVVFICAYSVGLGPLPWVYMGEILPQNTKGLTSSLTAMLNWILAFIVIQYFQAYQDLVGFAWNWWTFAIWSGVGVIFTFFCIPETSGRTLEEIQQGLHATVAS